MSLREHYADLEFPFLTEKDIEELKELGYEPVKRLGEGRTSHALLTKFKKGDVLRYRVVKIPKDEQIETPGHLINTKRGDPNKIEVMTSNELSHPNIIAIVDNFDLNGRNAIAEEYTDATDLETIVNSVGKITDEDKIRAIFRQVTEGEKYLLHRAHKVHRDIKPSNIFVSDNGLVQIGDLQNCARGYELSDVVLPTRGGSPFAHPSLLEAPVTEWPTRASEETEIYSIGASLYFALTGELPFDYKLEFDEDGKEILIGDKKFKVSLKSGDKKIEKIDEKKHERQLKKKLKKVPKAFRKIVHKSLSLNDKVEYRNIFELEDDINNSEKGLARKIGEAVLSITKPAVISAAIIGALGTGFYWISTMPKEKKSPTLSETLILEDYRNFNLETLSENEKKHSLNILRPYQIDASKRLPELEEMVISENFFGRITYANKFNHMIEFSRNIHRFDPRLVSSLIKAGYLSNEKNIEKKYLEKRVSPIHVPKDFVIKRNMIDYGDEGLDLDGFGAIPYGIMYLRQCLGTGNNIADVFAQYYCEREEIDKAKIESKSSGYFPKEKINEDGTITIEPGYGQFLPNSDLVNRAVALYLITDEDGNTDFSKIPRLEKPLKDKFYEIKEEKIAVEELKEERTKE